MTAFVIISVPTQWQDAFVTTFAMGFVLLSVVVITGYAGQLSLGQFALAGFGAWIAGRSVDAWGWPVRAFNSSLMATRRRAPSTGPCGASGDAKSGGFWRSNALSEWLSSNWSSA